LPSGRFESTALSGGQIAESKKELKRRKRIVIIINEDTKRWFAEQMRVHSKCCVWCHAKKNTDPARYANMTLHYRTYGLDRQFIAFTIPWDFQRYMRPPSYC